MPLNIICAQMPLNMICAQMPLNIICAQMPLNIINAQMPLNMICAQMPLNIICAQKPLNMICAQMLLNIICAQMPLNMICAQMPLNNICAQMPLNIINAQMPLNIICAQMPLILLVRRWRETSPPFPLNTSQMHASLQEEYNSAEWQRALQARPSLLPCTFIQNKITNIYLINASSQRLLNYKDTKPLMSAFLLNWPVNGVCGKFSTDCIDWRYIHSLVGIFDPACELLPPCTEKGADTKCYQNRLSTCTVAI